MCGIVGFIDTPWNEHAQFALNAIISRGPDEKQLWARDNITLGHTRLSIIDIAGGHQPMLSQDERYCLVFNGEIYNYQKLRAELERLGHRFLTQSDTEVVLQAFIEWQHDVVYHLDGMFAFAIWDNAKKHLYCARDRVGIKPFFYSNAKGFAFSSSLKSFIDVPGFPKNLNYEALRDYLSFQTCLAPDSFLAQVQQLPPATYLSWELQSNALSLTTYWQPSEVDQTIDRHDIINRVDDALRDSVKAQLMSDVPLGAFLSGGIDSSLMIHYMHEVGVSSVDAFTLRFGQNDYDETPHATAVANHFGCQHHVLDAPLIDAATWQRAICDLDQPLADPAYVMTHALSEFTQKQVTVSISGDGGDELFAGYERYRLQALNFPRKPHQPIVRFLVDHGLLPASLLGKSLYGLDKMFYRQVELGHWTKGRKSLYHYLHGDVHKASKIDHSMHLWRVLAGEMTTRDLMNADLWTYLSENCLTKTDRASMAHSLEVRVPMLGNELLDLATSIPTEHHFDESGGKRILKALAKRHLPECTWNRKKHGFSVPLLDLFNGEWAAPMNQLVHSCHEIAPFLNHTAVQSLWDAAKQKKGSRRLAYTFVVLLQWLDSNKLC